jgi:hypothetical protein
MYKLFRIALILMVSPLAWAQGCGTPKNFAALVGLLVDVGQPSELGLSLIDNEGPEKYYATLVRGEFPELFLTKEKWTKRHRQNRIDQWVLKYAIDSSSVLHKELREKGQHVVREKHLSTKKADGVECQIFGVFLGSKKSKIKVSRS